MGMAKPTESPTDWKRRVAEAAVSMPTTWPERLINGPPESPGSRGASIWMSPESVSGWLPSRSEAVMVWFNPCTVPLTVCGAPPTPPAFPRATIGSPTLTLEDFPRGTVGRLVAPWMWMTARSSPGTVPTTTAAYRRPVATSSTAMLVELSMTWLLVSTSPSGVRMTPVPAPEIPELSWV